ncbi:MAG: hypothetical protein K2K26_09640, partial [Muribaculaceae bacterium]|nr:hypothetical protein [Muribaculaceae bacterium]
MKKFFLLLAVALFALPSLARDFEYNGVIYTVTDEKNGTCQTKAGDKDAPGNEVSGEVVIRDVLYDGDNKCSVPCIGY